MTGLGMEGQSSKLKVRSAGETKWDRRRAPKDHILTKDASEGDRLGEGRLEGLGGRWKEAHKNQLVVPGEKNALDSSEDPDLLDQSLHIAAEKS